MLSQWINKNEKEKAIGIKHKKVKIKHWKRIENKY